MTPAQRKAILKVIDKDAEIQGVLCDYKTEQMCILGGLASAAGIPLTHLKGMSGLDPSDTEIIHAFFGLSEEKQTILVHINDEGRYGLRSMRQAALRKRVKSWVVSRKSK